MVDKESGHEHQSKLKLEIKVVELEITLKKLGDTDLQQRTATHEITLKKLKLRDTNLHQGTATEEIALKKLVDTYPQRRSNDASSVQGDLK